MTRITSRIRLFTAAAFSSLIAAGCGGNDSVGGPDTIDVGPEGGTFRANGLVLEIPAGALDQAASLAIDSSEQKPNGYTVDGLVYRFKPAGLHFARPISITFPTGTPGESVFWTIDGTNDRFEKLPTTLAQNTAIALPTHFSEGFVGTQSAEIVDGSSDVGSPSPETGSDVELPDTGHPPNDSNNAPDALVDAGPPDTPADSGLPDTSQPPPDGDAGSSVDASVPPDALSDGVIDSPTADAAAGVTCTIKRKVHVDSQTCTQSTAVEQGVRFWLVTKNGDPEGSLGTDSRGIHDFYLWNDLLYPLFDTVDSSHTLYRGYANGAGNWGTGQRTGTVLDFTMDGQRFGGEDMTTPCGQIPNVAAQCSGATTLLSGPPPELSDAGTGDAGDAGDGGKDDAADARDSGGLVDSGPSTPVVCANGFGGPGRQLQAGLVVDSAGNIVLGGVLEGSMTVGANTLTSAGIQDIYLMKLDANCQPLWAKSFGDSVEQYFNAVAVDGLGNIFMAGQVKGVVDFGGGPLTAHGDYDIALVKFDTNGNHVWSKLFGDDGYQAVGAMRASGDGTIVLTGAFNGSLTFGGPTMTGVPDGNGSDIYLAKLDTNGNSVFGHMFPAPSLGHSHQLRGLAVDGAGNIAITGLFNSSLDLGAGPIAPAGTDGGTQGFSMFVAKYSPIGAYGWAKIFPANGGSIAFDPLGNLVMYASAPVTFTVDYGTGKRLAEGALVSYAPDGTARWGNGDFNLGGATVATDFSGRILWTGSFNSSIIIGGALLTSAGQYDIFRSIYDGDGHYVMAERYGDPDDQNASSIVGTSSGQTVMAGSFKGSMVFGGTTYTSFDGFEDVFVVKFP